MTVPQGDPEPSARVATAGTAERSGQQVPLPKSGLTWSGEIPSQKWMNFYTKVLTKLEVNSGLTLTVTVECNPEGGVSPQKVERLKALCAKWDSMTRSSECRHPLFDPSDSDYFSLFCTRTVAASLLDVDQCRTPLAIRAAEDRLRVVVSDRPFMASAIGLAAADKRASMRFFCSFGKPGLSANIASTEASVAVSVFMPPLFYNG